MSAVVACNRRRFLIASEAFDDLVELRWGVSFLRLTLLELLLSSLLYKLEEDCIRNRLFVFYRSLTELGNILYKGLLIALIGILEAILLFYSA